MSIIPRRTLEELLFLYDRDPERKDIYVEGSFDASIIQWFLTQCNLSSVAVYPVDSVDIPDETLIASDRRTNNRERVVYLSEVLSQGTAKCIACIIDADFCYFRGETAPGLPLLWTDYSCMEMYFFNLNCMTKFFKLYCQKKDWPVSDITDALAVVLEELFLYRCANDYLEWHMDWLDRLRDMEIRGWKICLEDNSFVARLLNKNNRSSDKAEFLQVVSTLREQLSGDPRMQINGHDFVALLAWYIHKKGIGGSSSHVDSVAGCIATTLEHSALMKEGLFQNLIQHLS